MVELTERELFLFKYNTVICEHCLLTLTHLPTQCAPRSNISVPPSLVLSGTDNVRPPTLSKHKT